MGQGDGEGRKVSDWTENGSSVYGMKSPEMDAFSGMPITVSFRGRGQRAFGYSGTNWSF